MKESLASSARKLGVRTLGLTPETLDLERGREREFSSSIHGTVTLHEWDCVLAPIDAHDQQLPELCALNSSSYEVSLSRSFKISPLVLTRYRAVTDSSKRARYDDEV